ncbi:uncharacterized protein K489DRAFT_252196 [Dissoconium aciculare CBS 342.82]|uniref:Uncharacterized protein n=1 Tax=Dissoconium aciculare CBS 342.82 TaxID=1314786 RepID=A0A6J3M0R6_9PEZI|nr:uncharacterized protein K489DRAFT_252196 [Dissoconium aciculare CBS 342.82]KAF1821616.1 hypothetical protein K489DRAFT_252196 [Dissoconium aciculare CBS 342.82]
MTRRERLRYDTILLCFLGTTFCSAFIMIDDRRGVMKARSAVFSCRSRDMAASFWNLLLGSPCFDSAFARPLFGRRTRREKEGLFWTNTLCAAIRMMMESHPCGEKVAAHAWPGQSPKARGSFTLSLTSWRSCYVCI